MIAGKQGEAAECKELPKLQWRQESTSVLLPADHFQLTLVVSAHSPWNRSGLEWPKKLKPSPTQMRILQLLNLRAQPEDGSSLEVKLALQKYYRGEGEKKGEGGGGGDI